MQEQGLTSTKFIVTIVTIGLGTAALFSGLLSGELWIAGVVGLAVNYVMGNVKSQAIERLGAHYAAMV